jgi:hypothetical protein
MMIFKGRSQMKIECEKKKFVCIKEMFIIDGKQFETEKLIGCLNALEETDGTSNLVRINDKSMEELLVKSRLAYQTVHGSWSRLSIGRIRSFRKKLVKVLTEHRGKKQEK